MMKSKNKAVRFSLLNIFLVLGMLVSLFLVYEHFTPSASEFCSIGENLDCGVVNKSPYANLDGISYLLTIDLGWDIPFLNISGIHPILDFITTNAFLGFLTLLFIFLLNIKYKNKKFLWITREANRKWVIGILVFGILYGFYLFLIQHYVLKTYCLFCLTLDAIMVISLVIAIMTKNG